METEGKAKVVASVWGAKFVQFLAALAVLPRSVWKKRLNSTVSFKPFFQLEHHLAQLLQAVIPASTCTVHCTATIAAPNGR